MSGAATGADGAERRGARVKLVLLAAIFFGPLAAAFLLYYGLPSVRPAGSAAHGVLVSPPQPLVDVPLARPDGSGVAASFLHGRWSIVWVGPGDCGADCRAALVGTRQARLLLGKDAGRVQRVYLYTGAPPGTKALDGQGDDILMLAAGGADAAKLRASFEIPGAGRVYLVDPHANLMMSYASGEDPRNILEDLKRLLKYSHIG